MKITKYPQSCFLIETKNKKILIDPGDMVNEKDIDQFEHIDIILFTHTHNDHCYHDYAKKLRDKHNARVLGNQEVADKLSDIDVEVVQEGNIQEIDGIKIEVQGGVHGYWFKMANKPLPQDNGFVIDDGEKRVYHTGDTVAFYNDIQVDIALVPVCGHGVVMEPDIAIEFAQMVKASLVIPMHYENDTHPKGTEKFEELVKEKGVNYKILSNGEGVEI